MKTVKNALSRFFTMKPDNNSWTVLRHYQEWDRMRARALSPSERSEIDAIFSRSL